jgi:type IV pilus assembly protein PilY1
LPPPVAATSISAANQQAGAYALDPPLGTAGAAPLVMLNISRDQALFFKAYNDFSDLDNNGTLETTYTNSIDYAGYFDPQKCYTYSDTDGYFSPDSLATGTYKHTCSDKFSGNFLNWASMTRMDEVRKILYGGKRSTDTDTLTVLERAYLPTDAHSFAKYYGGSDLSKFVPTAFTGNTDMPTGTAGKATTVANLNDNKATNTLWTIDSLSSGFQVEVGDQLKFTAQSDGANPLVIITPVRDFSNGKPRVRLELGEFSSNCTTVDAGSNAATSCIKELKAKSGWNVVNLSRTGLTICNTTVQGTSTNASQTNTAPPLMRLATGNYALWGANEQKQCLWRKEKSNSQSGFVNGFLSNGNRAAFSGVYANAENPVQATASELKARVRVCVPSLLGTEKCKQYPDAKNTNNPYKPFGLLQKYGETGDIKFGLVTHSYDKNVSGGVLRAALPDPGVNSGNFITSEIDPTNGRRTGNPGIIATLDKLRIYGYRYDQGDSYEADDGCPYQKTGIGGGGTSDVDQGNCSSWGNPMAESYVETLRYLAHKKANANFDPGTGGKDAALGLSVVTWNDPISEANYCAALNVININASAISYDADQLGGFAGLNTGKTVKAWTDIVGEGEGIAGHAWFVGNSSSSYAGTDNNLCSAKTVANFGDVLGLCPEVPALSGSYNIAGAAYGAHINRIRNLGNDASGQPIVPDDDKTSLKVTTFGVQLATNTPQIRVKVPGTTDKFVTIIPAYRLVLPTGVGGGELVDFKVLSQTTDGTTARGTFYANWEDSFAGGDFDQDMWGIISYEITNSKVKITTKPVSASTSNGQGFGYIINGTTFTTSSTPTRPRLTCTTRLGPRSTAAPSSTLRVVARTVP